jgi:pimeloyl-ACP methyl ester carboxylesterase
VARFPVRVSPSVSARSAPARPLELIGRQLPRALLSLLEVRAPLEFAVLLATLPTLARAPKGDGHAVLLLPGFAAGDATLEPLRLFLRSRGYDAETWGLGKNVGFNRRYSRAIEQKVRYMHHKSGRKVSLVGWSLGGVFAFYAAHVAPECVRAAISLGSPLRLDPDHPPPPSVLAMYRALENPQGTLAHAARSRSRAMRTPPPVPSTCLYSDTDGIVPPQQATLDGDPENHENIRVPGSHAGLGVNFLVMWIIADRLAQPEGKWAPFRPSGAFERAFRRLDAHDAAP